MNDDDTQICDLTESGREVSLARDRGDANYIIWLYDRRAGMQIALDEPEIQGKILDCSSFFTGTTRVRAGEVEREREHAIANVATATRQVQKQVT